MKPILTSLQLLLLVTLSARGQVVLEPSNPLIKLPDVAVEISRIKGRDGPALIIYYNRAEFDEQGILDLIGAEKVEKIQGRSIFVWKEGRDGQIYTVVEGDVRVPEKRGRVFLIDRAVFLKYLEGCVEINWDKWSPLVEAQ